MPMLLIFHDVTDVDIQQPYIGLNDFSSLTFKDDRGGKVVIALTEAGHKSLRHAVAVYEPLSTKGPAQ